MNLSKSLPITKLMVWDAYKLAREKGKAAGVDGRVWTNLPKTLRTTFIGSGTGWHQEATSRLR